MLKQLFKANLKGAVIVAVICLLLPACSEPLYKANLNTTICNSTPDNTCDWMGNLLNAHASKPIALINICLPASHDAAMYLTRHCTAFANTGNTQTQYLPMKQQLEAGLRLFDIRPSFYEHEFYTEHSTHCDGLGCKGDMLKNMLRATREFLNAHPEIVILQLSHFCHTSATDTALLSLLNSELGEYIYKETAPVDLPFIKMPLRQILPPGSKTGKVILLIEGADNSPANKARGFFSTEILKKAGGWTNDNEYPLLLQHQLKNFAAYAGNNTELFELAWQITQHDGEAFRCALAPHSRVAIVNGAHAANLQLPAVLDGLIKNGDIRTGKIPNIIWSDFVDTMVVRQCMKLSRLSVE